MKKRKVSRPMLFVLLALAALLVFGQHNSNEQVRQQQLMDEQILQQQIVDDQVRLFQQQEIFQQQLLNQQLINQSISGKLTITLKGE